MREDTPSTSIALAALPPFSYCLSVCKYSLLGLGFPKITLGAGIWPKLGSELVIGTPLYDPLDIFIATCFR